MPGGAEGRTVLNSPLAERLGGPLQLQQQQQQLGRMAGIARQMLQGIARALADTDPKRAAEFETIGAKLLKMIPPSQGAPTSPVGVQGMAQRMPQGGPGPGQMPTGTPPPPAGGSALSGPAAGM